VAGQTKFPAAKDSHTGADPFGFQPVTDLLATQLLSAVSSSATVLPVNSVSGWNARGFAVIRDADPDSLILPEIVTYTSTPAGQFAGVTRGVGSTAKAWPAGSIVELNPVSRHHDDLAAAIVAMQQTYLCDLQDTGGQSIPNNAVTALTWDTELSDPQGMHTGSGSVITMPVSGIYVFHAQVQWDAGVTGTRHMMITNNAIGGYIGYVSMPANLAASNIVQCVTPAVRVGAGTVATAYVYQDSGGSVSVGKGANAGRFTAVFLGGYT